MLSVIKLHFPASCSLGWSYDSSDQWEISRSHWAEVFGKTFKWGWLSWWISFSPLLLSFSCLKCKHNDWHSRSTYRTRRWKRRNPKKAGLPDSWWHPHTCLDFSPLYYLSRDRIINPFFIYLLLFKFSVFSLDLIPAPNQRLSLDIHILHNSTLVHRFIVPLPYWVPYTPVHRTAMGWLLM